ncbi:MAG: mechanosensitive ion channel family protein [Ferruginibacter sp.]
MNFLDKIILDNTVRSLLIVFATILLTLLLKKYLSRYIAAQLYKLVLRIWKNINKQTFINLVMQPLGWFLVVLITVFSVDKLNFPQDFHYTLYGHTTEDILTRFGTGIIIVSFIWLVLRLVDFFAAVLEEKANQTIDTRDNQLIVFFRDFLKVIIVIIGTLIIVKACFNQPIGDVLTGLSIVGAALALAAKESLENLIASFIIFFDKPFFTGDIVKINAVTGTIEHIGLRSTRIRTADQTLVTVPNKQMVDGVVDNWSMRTQRRAEIKLDLASNTPLHIVEGFIQALKKFIDPSTREIISANIFLKELNKNGISIVAEYFTQPFTLQEYFELKEKIHFQILAEMENHHIEFAGEESTIRVKTEEQ